MTDRLPDNDQHGPELPCTLRDFVCNNSMDAMCVFRETTLIEINTRCLEMFGYDSREELKSYNIFDHIVPQQAAILKSRINHIFAGRPDSTSQIYTCIKRSGDLFQAEISTIPWPYEHPIGVSILKDVTRREQGIQALKKSEQLYRTLAESLPAGVMLEDTIGNRIYVNDLAAKLSGYTIEELMESAVLTHPDETEVQRLYEKAVTEGTSERDRETRFVRKDGSIFWVSLSWQPVKDSEGQIQGVHTIFIDISHRKHMESVLRETENQYRVLAESASDMIWRMDTNGLFTFVSPASRQFGYEPEEMIGHLCMDFMADFVPEEAKAIIQADLHNPTQKHREVKMICKDGRIAWIELSINFVLDNGKVTGVHGIARNINERKKAEEALRESEAKYRAIVEDQTELITRFGPDLVLTFANDAYLRYFRTTIDQVLGKSFIDLIPQEDLDLVYTTFESFNPKHPVVTYEHRVYGPDGEIRWHQWTDRAFFDDQGNPLEFQAVGRDITARRLAEEAVHESEARYRGLVESQQDLIVRTTPEGVFTFANDVYCKLFGKKREELLGRSYVPLVHEEDLPHTLDVVNQLFAPPYRGTVEQRAQTIHGWRWLAWEDCAIRDEKGNVVEIQAVGRDITAKKQAEEALKISEGNNRALLAAIPDLMLRTSSEGIFIDYKTSDEVPLYLPPDVFMGKKIEDVMPPEMAARWIELSRLALTTGKTQQFEYELPIGSEIRYFEDRVVKSGDDEILSIIRDITARKQAEDALHRAHDDLARAYELQREFLNNVTHEVRTPLTAVKGYVQMVLEGTAGPVSEEQVGLLRKVLSSSEHLLKIVDTVLEIARLKSGRMLLRPKACQPGSVVEKSVSQILPQASQKGLSVIVTGTQAKCMGVYDEEKLTSILTNLLSNAVKFTQHGDIGVLVESNATGMIVIVSDTGLGIAQENLGSIFDEFQQLHYPAKHKPSGFGIGLAIVARMVETIGATLIVSSASGIGTAFTLHVPVLEEW